MKRKLKVVNVGAGSAYTPDCVEIFNSISDEFVVDEWVLMDINEERLETVGNMTKMLAEENGFNAKITFTTDLNKAVKNADFVISTIRVGNIDSRIIDETIPQKYGLIGQETTAPGGMMMGLRNIPAMIEIARAIEKHANPNAWLINLCNPSGMLTEAVNQYTDIKCAGLCNNPIVGAQLAVQFLKAKPEDVFCKSIGLNHLCWMKVYHRGEDVTDFVSKEVDRWLEEEYPPLSTKFTPSYIKEFTGWIGHGPYERYYYETPEVVEELKNATKKWPKMVEMTRKQVGGLLDHLDTSKITTRAHMVKEIEKIALKAYEDKDKRGYELTKSTRGGIGYAEAGISLANAIWNNKNEIHRPDVRNYGAVYGLGYKDIATTTAMVNASGIYPLATGPLPPHMVSFIQSAKAYEHLAVEAAVTGDYHAALEALITNSLVSSFNMAKAALDELLVAHEAYLPNFADVIGKLKNGEKPY